MSARGIFPLFFAFLLEIGLDFETKIWYFNLRETLGYVPG